MNLREEKVRQALDWDQGLGHFDGDVEMFVGMVGKFESLTFNETLRKLHDSALQKNWEEFRLHAHTLKGASAYLAATGVQENSLKLQLRCDAFFKETKENTLPPGGVEVFEHDIIELLLALFQDSKYLKERISQITDQPFDLSQVELYEKSIKRKYNPPPPVCCGNCKIF